MLPSIAAFFNVSVDDLLGINEINKKKEIDSYINEYERQILVDTPKCYEMIKKAVREFPNEYSIVVRYMSALHCKAEKYEGVTDEIEQIYNKIQSNCTDDSIRIKAKRILINHYRCRNSREYDLKAIKIAEDLPSVNDCKEYVSSYVFRPMGNGKDPFYTSDGKHIEACQDAIEASLIMLYNSIINYCVYDDSFSCDEKISALETSVSILKAFYTDGYYGSQGLGLVYTYGHLSWLNFLNGNEEKALEYLEICADEAIKFDAAPDESVSNSFFFNGKTLKKPKRGKTCRERIKLYAMNQYPFSEEFKNRKEFKEIIKKF